MDIVIRNVRVVDGSGAPPLLGDVGIEKGTFVHVGPDCPQKGEREMDGTGLVAAPGFVDIHSHSDYYLLVNPLAESKVRQGVTTEIGGNCGYSAAPVFGRTREERIRIYQDLFGLDLPWEGVGDYYNHLEKQGISVNFGLLIGHNTVRSSVMYGSNREPRAKELAEMIEVVRRGMQEGAVGLSTGLIYPPACFAKPDELIALCKAAAAEGGIFTVHLRSEGNRLLEAIDEVIDVAERAGIPLQISHLKTSGRKNWQKLDAVLKKVESARRRGVDAACDRYPYTASNTGLSAVLPDWVFEGGVERLMERLSERGTRDQIRREIYTEHPEEDYFQNIMICAVTRPADEQYVGKRIADCARAEGKEPIDFISDLLIAERNMVDAIYFTMSGDNLRRILQQPYVMIGSDSGAKTLDGPLGEGAPHPRAYGTYPRVLQQFVREEGTLTLEEAVRKMTYDPLQRIGIRNRGLVRKGFAADLVLFDPDKIEDPSTYEVPKQAPRGIRKVLVNGVIVVEDGALTGERPGRILRRERRSA
jgi:N-acyl-D-amino-acid deacylase